MIELRTLGTLSVRDTADGKSRELSLGPRQTALLAYLALARPRGPVPRDRLMAVFWPELPGDRARAALRQALYRLGLELGRDIVVRAGDTHVELQWESVRCDAAAFEAAVAGERHEAALDLYEGELLAGYHLVPTAEFEHWLDDERSRLRRLGVESAMTLARRSEAEGNPAAAANWVRRAVVLAPYEETLIRDLIRLLTAVGDRSGAIHEYQKFAARLASDLELEPSAELRAAIASIRTAEAAVDLTLGNVAVRLLPRPTAGDTGAQGSAESTTDSLWAAGADGVAPVGTAPSSAGARDHAGGSVGRAWRDVRGLAAPFAGVAVLAAVILQCFGDSLVDPASVTGPAELRANRVLVLPFESRTDDPAVATAGRVAAEWVTQGMQRSGLVEVIDAATAVRLLADVEPSDSGGTGVARLRDVAENARAGLVVWGTVSRTNGDLEFRVQVTDAREGRVLRTLDPIVAAPEDPGPALVALQSRVAGALATLVDERLATLVAPSSPPPTFEAYQEFVLGLDRFGMASYMEAFEYFERAARLDSSFIRARFWAAHAFYNSGPPARARADSLILSIVPLRDRLPLAERAGLDMFVARIHQDPEGALRAARQAARLAPQSDWQYMTARISLELGRPREALAELERLNPARGWLETFMGYWTVRLDASHWLGRYREELKAVREARRIYRGDPSAMPQAIDFSETRALIALGRLDEMDRLVERRLTVYRGEGWDYYAANLYWYVGRELRAHGFAGEARAWFERCLETGHRIFVAPCLWYLGRPEEAYAFARPLADSTVSLAFQAVYSAARLGRKEEAEQLLARLWARFPGYEQPGPLNTAALLGQRERALELLKQPPVDRAALWFTAHTLDNLDSLRNDPFIEAVLHPTR